MKPLNENERAQCFRSHARSSVSSITPFPPAGQTCAPSTRACTHARCWPTSATAGGCRATGWTCIAAFVQWEEHRVFVVLIELGAPSCHILLVAWGQTADTTRLPLHCVGVVDGPDSADGLGVLSVDRPARAPVCSARDNMQSVISVGTAVGPAHRPPAVGAMDGSAIWRGPTSGG